MLFQDTCHFIKTTRIGTQDYGLQSIDIISPISSIYRSRVADETLFKQPCDLPVRTSSQTAARAASSTIAKSGRAMFFQLFILLFAITESHEERFQKSIGKLVEPERQAKCTQDTENGK
jgi:hypothetical protein